MKSTRTTAATGRCTLVALAVSLLCGCEPLALTAFGVGASAGVQHTLSGVTYRTFTAPSPRVKAAALSALGRMGIKVDSTEKMAGGELIKASTPDRQIEVEIERISANTTRLRAVAKQPGLLYDSATATEIILQTEKILGSA
ncbi:MAG: DUF3568 family protein [Proteobacteria bacterium]|nr:DUF3568 family protein [Pseudomonadota bacterium]